MIVYRIILYKNSINLLHSGYMYTISRKGEHIMVKMYVKFSVILIAFLMANTVAFTIGLAYLRMNGSLASLQGIMAIAGVLLANCAAIQLLVAGKYSIDTLFYTGTAPIIGFFLSYYSFTSMEQPILAIVLYSISLIVGLVLFVITMSSTENKKSLVL